jgi:hypothetical protein
VGAARLAPPCAPAPSTHALRGNGPPFFAPPADPGPAPARPPTPAAAAPPPSPLVQARTCGWT